MKCRLCESTKLQVIFVNRHCPVQCHSFDRKPSRKLRKLTVLQCGRCSLVQLADDYPTAKYEDDYQRNISHSESAQTHAKEMARLMLLTRPTKFLEVGCGSGMFSKMIKDSGSDVLAFEPSRPAAIQAAAAGISVCNEFFGPGTPAHIKGFDSFAMRFVLEHLNSPLTILRQLFNRCKPGAVGLIEVPNSHFHMQAGRWTEFFPEHLSYFTRGTLATAASLAGFDILKIQLTMNNEFLAMFVQKPDRPHLSMKHCSMIEPGATTYCWGASGAAVTRLATMPSSGIKYLIDTDPNKHGLFCPGSGIKIVDPGIITREPPETVLIMAPSYTKEIVKQLREMGYKGRIGTLLPDERWL